MVQASLGKNQDLILKMTQAKKVSGMAQVVQCLPCKGETLSSNPSMAEKKKRTQKRSF
jgi:pyruvate/2-oxoacid:ferredoxin oxidoreductase beta subunit